MAGSLLASLTIIGIILCSGVVRIYVHRKFNVSEHFEHIDQAVKRQQLAKRNLHNAQGK